MEGVQILSKSEILTISYWFYWMYIISSLFLLIFFIIYRITKNDIFAIIGFIICVVLALVGGIGAGTIRVPTGEYEYKVTIDNTVNMIEFNTKYEIITQEGLIYTIRERK